MERYVDMKEISDGRFYGLNDMAKVGCNDCQGCSKCCSGMGSSIVLTPYDVWLIKSKTGLTFEELLAKYVELGVEQGVILPHIKMNDTTDSCNFLDENKRCSIHSHRPGVCRLFPLGRFYENGDFSYFLQNRECPYPCKTKVKVEKWIDIDDIEENNKFINAWHDFVKKVQRDIADNRYDDKTVRQINMFILTEFFVKDFDGDFYEEFDKRLSEAGVKIG